MCLHFDARCDSLPVLFTPFLLQPLKTLHYWCSSRFRSLPFCAGTTKKHRLSDQRLLASFAFRSSWTLFKACDTLWGSQKSRLWYNDIPLAWHTYKSVSNVKRNQTRHNLKLFGIKYHPVYLSARYLRMASVKYLQKHAETMLLWQLIARKDVHALLVECMKYIEILQSHEWPP